ncbi:BTAD domain-containing putative transcriptional regulator [Streptomyces sp. NPDC059556]|uniref:BTAD domain-containing putative transcriptional regulator n=1 Tax=Streptomyces sp. NPDC059556 TaxID=3346863 RepID=UPI0036CAA2D7
MIFGRLRAYTRAHERFAEQLVEALYRTGRQTEALTEYRRGNGHLRERLGVAPRAELQRLELAILRGEDLGRAEATRRVAAPSERTAIPGAPDPQDAPGSPASQTSPGSSASQASPDSPDSPDSPNSSASQASLWSPASPTPADREARSAPIASPVASPPAPPLPSVPGFTGRETEVSSLVRLLTVERPEGDAERAPSPSSPERPASARPPSPCMSPTW